MSFDISSLLGSPDEEYSDAENRTPLSEENRKVTPLGLEYEISDGEVTITSYRGSEAAVIIPDEIDGLAVTKLGFMAFSVCSSLIEITIPGSVTEIGYGAFLFCCALTKINVSSSNEHFTANDGVLYDKNMTKLIRFPAGKSGSFTVPDSVIAIENLAFSSCRGLEEVNIPKSVLDIDRQAFSYYCSLTQINVSNSNHYYASKDGVLYNEALSMLIYCPAEKSGALTIPDSVLFIDDSAFENCHKLTEITIPDSVITIGSLAFENCDSLTEITIPDSVTSIGNEAFHGCDSITVYAPYEASYYGYEPDEGVTWVVR